MLPVNVSKPYSPCGEYTFTHICKKHLHMRLIPGYGQLEDRGCLLYHCVLSARHIILKIC